MPEGPEIRRAADRVGKAVTGRPATDVFFGHEHLQRYQSRLKGRIVTAVEPRGKAMLTRFEGRLVVYSHNQLYGRWYTTRAGKQPRTGRQLRFAVHNREASAWLYSASEIEVLQTHQLSRHPYLAKLGPDPLTDGADAIAERVADSRFDRRSVAALLLDQGFIAGLGNYLRSEILFVASVDPLAKLATLDDKSRDRLAIAAFQITRRAYQTRGITNDPERVARLKTDGLSRRQYRHLVFGRDGQGCYLCADTIAKIAAAGRRLYYCPNCQTGGRVGARRRRKR
jgi:endonuclease-8